MEFLGFGITGMVAAIVAIVLGFFAEKLQNTLDNRWYIAVIVY